MIFKKYLFFSNKIFACSVIVSSTTLSAIISMIPVEGLDQSFRFNRRADIVISMASLEYPFLYEIEIGFVIPFIVSRACLVSTLLLSTMKCLSFISNVIYWKFSVSKIVEISALLSTLVFPSHRINPSFDSIHIY